MTNAFRALLVFLRAVLTLVIWLAVWAVVWVPVAVVAWLVIRRVRRAGPKTFK